MTVQQGFCAVGLPSRNVSSASRIREEVDILALRLKQFVPGMTLSEFKAGHRLFRLNGLQTQEIIGFAKGSWFVSDFESL